MGSLKIIRDFEDKLYRAIQEKYKDLPKLEQNTLIHRHLLVGTMDAHKFYHIFRQQKSYDAERLDLLCEYLLDIKLQLYFIEIDISSYNHLIYLPHQNENLVENSRLHLIHLSFDQSIILKSRIAWERFTNFIYYLETGRILDNQRTKSKTKSKTFKEFVTQNENGRF